MEFEIWRQNSKLILISGQVNASLEEDRKNLMSHVTVLLSQYHELLTQTIDDKEHFHEEEKMFYEKMNNLSRQKEKLEEKIMDTYKNMNTPRAKKSGFSDQWIAKSIKMMSKISGKKVPTSASARHLHHLHHHNTASNLGDEHDSSSVGSGGNDSLGSGHHSPSSELGKIFHKCPKYEILWRMERSGEVTKSLKWPKNIKWLKSRNCSKSLKWLKSINCSKKLKRWKSQ